MVFLNCFLENLIQLFNIPKHAMYECTHIHTHAEAPTKTDFHLTREAGRKTKLNINLTKNKFAPVFFCCYHVVFCLHLRYFVVVFCLFRERGAYWVIFLNHSRADSRTELSVVVDYVGDDADDDDDDA